MINTITSFASMKVPEGERLVATYSKVNEDGTYVAQNQRFSILAMDDEIKEAIATIEAFLATKID